ncbi:hypothetical protein MMC24_006653 [Lignoscripta atroalba]|nr:hypothetical protein [Lignoscripta atroalba]
MTLITATSSRKDEDKKERIEKKVEKKDEIEKKNEDEEKNKNEEKERVSPNVSTEKEIKEDEKEDIEWSDEGPEGGDLFLYWCVKEVLPSGKFRSNST